MANINCSPNIDWWWCIGISLAPATICNVWNMNSKQYSQASQSVYIQIIIICCLNLQHISVLTTTLLPVILLQIYSLQPHQPTPVICYASKQESPNPALLNTKTTWMRNSDVKIKDCQNETLCLIIFNVEVDSWNCLNCERETLIGLITWVISN